MSHPVDVHVGRRLKQIRTLRRMSQTDVARKLSLSFQQIQKYECGANRVSASRLFELSEALSVPVQHFYEGLSEHDPISGTPDETALAPDILSKKETMDLVRAYYNMGETPRKHLLDLAKSLEASANAELQAQNATRL